LRVSGQAQQIFAGVWSLSREQQQDRCRLPTLLQLLEFALQVGQRQVCAAAPDHQTKAALELLWLGGDAVLGLEQADQTFAKQWLGQDQQLGCGLGLRHVRQVMQFGAR